MRSFASDNNSGVHPLVMEALSWANADHALGYGDDQWTEEAVAKIKETFTMLWRAAGSPAAGGSASFADVPADSYYAQAVAWAIENGITTGVGGGRFDPNSTSPAASPAAAARISPS